MREFLLELYLGHGDRWHERNYTTFTRYGGAIKEGFVVYDECKAPAQYKITPKGLEYLKNA